MSTDLDTPQIDPFTLEIIKAKLLAIASEMSVVLARTSMSPIIYEVLDFACGITDAEGQVIAQANGLTLFTGTFMAQVQSVIRKFGPERIKPGDIFMTNGPYDGGTHTCDIALIMPIFVAMMKLWLLAYRSPTGPRWAAKHPVVSRRMQPRFIKRACNSQLFISCVKVRSLKKLLRLFKPTCACRSCRLVISMPVLRLVVLPGNV